jgi:hypothetical protein
MGRSRVYATSAYIANHNGRPVIPGSTPHAARLRAPMSRARHRGADIAEAARP